jgi:hypothetical protein
MSSAGTLFVLKRHFVEHLEPSVDISTAKPKPPRGKLGRLCWGESARKDVAKLGFDFPDPLSLSSMFCRKMFKNNMILPNSCEVSKLEGLPPWSFPGGSVTK